MHVLVPALAAFLYAAPPPDAGVAADASELVGLWGAERMLGPEVSGDLVIARDRDGWLARIGPFEARAPADGQRVHFELSGARGEFRGQIERGRLTGHWIQPPTRLEGNRYATPVTLAPDGHGAFRGIVRPKEDRISLYLLVRREPDGTLSGFVRNPERNLGVRWRTIRIEKSGDQVVLRPGREGQPPLLGKLSNGPVLSLFVPDIGTTLDFTRRGPGEAVGFEPRAGVPGPYAWRRPGESNDGWRTAAPTEVGLDQTLLAALVQRVLDTRTEGLATPYVQAILIARRGKLVLDEYFYGFDAERPHDSRSAGKSFGTTLVGIAIDRGVLSLDAKLVALLGQPGRPFAHPDERKDRIRLADAISMSTGLSCDDNDDASPGNEDRMQVQESQPDWYRYMLDLPMVRPPHEKAFYCSGGINLGGAAVAATTQTWLPDYFRRNLAEPLAFGRYYFNLMPTGEGYLGGGLFLRPRDHLKLAQLFLDGGRWRGKQIVSGRWVKAATSPQASINGPDDYGFGWWLISYPYKGRTVRAFHTSGNGGQMAIAIPELELAVVFQAANYNNFPVWSKFRDEWLPQYVIGAVKN